MPSPLNWGLCALLATSAAAAGPRGAPESEAPDRVAIIGAGIAGSACAWFLKDVPGLEITVFEPGPVGGRVREVLFPAVDPVNVEAGGAAIHSTNKHMAEFIDALGLHRDTSSAALLFARQQKVDSDVADGGAASWNGQSLLKLSPFDFPVSLLRTRRLVTKVIGQWQQIYDLQTRNASFDHPWEMLKTLGLDSLASISARDWLKDKKLDKRFLEAFVDGVSRVNYGQDSSINAFADSVSLAGAGLVGSLYAVKEGNSRVMSGLLASSGAKLRTQSVAAVRRSATSEGGYEVCTLDGQCEVFTSVVVAAPLEFANLTLETGLQPTTPRRPYQVTVATFVLAEGLSAQYFGAASGGTVSADTVTTTSN
ncbi:unnamed protein product, partial [Polarella glacialis]